MTSRARLLALFAAALVLVGIGVSAVAIVQSNDASGGDAVVLDVDDAVAATPPSTVAPVETPPSTVAADAAPATANDPVVEDADDGLSPLADLLGERYSAIPEQVEPRPRPIGLAVDSIDVAGTPIREVGLEPDGQLEVPDETEIGWYKYGATAGRPGATVLAAHVSWNGTTGPFFELGTVEPGNQIDVALDDGTTRRYEVIERTMYDKDQLPRDRIWRNTGPETLVLITCGGDFNPEIRRYRQNIVVYAVPIA